MSAYCQNCGFAEYTKNTNFYVCRVDQKAVWRWVVLWNHWCDLWKVRDGERVRVREA